jgi:hypothetical protein
MPLVKGIQQRLGKDKLEVLMLSVDAGYGYPKEEAIRGDAERLKAQNVSWPNVLLPAGFDDTQRIFNIDGYGLTLIGRDGKVLGVNLLPDQIDELLRKA